MTSMTSAGVECAPEDGHRHGLRRPLIICAAIVGGKPERGENPHRPVTCDQIAASAVDAWRAGAAMLHLHARDAQGAPTNAAQAYRELARRIRAAGCDAILNFSAGDNGGRSDHAERLAVVGAGAEVVSLGAGSFNCGDRVYDNPPAFRHAMAQHLRLAGVKPEFEVFDTGQLAAVIDMAREGRVNLPVMLTLVFGVPGGMPADPVLLRWLAQRIPAEWDWSVCCQSAPSALYAEMQLAAFALGGNIRTGLEDTVNGLGEHPAPTNAQLVSPWVSLARGCGRSVATPAQARALLGLA